MKRFLSLWLPEWPLDRLRRTRRALKTGSARPPSPTPAEPSRPFALLEAGAGGLRIAAANAAARTLGIVAGLALTDARARVPGLVCEDIDRAGDAAALKALGLWMNAFSPLVALDGADGLMLETTGCDHLHGGEAAMADRLSGVLTREGITHRIGLAGTPGAASALARGATGSGPHILGEGGEHDGLAGLPVAALRLSGEAERLLRRFGLTRIGQLYGIDRRALARRFHSREMADAVRLRLDQALGLRHEPLRPLRPPPAFAARLPCPEPLLSAEGVRAGLEQLLASLCADLTAAGQGGRGFALRAFRSDGMVSEVSVNAARPVRQASHIMRLFRERLERIDPGFGIDLLVLEAARVEAMTGTTAPLSGEMAGAAVDIEALAGLADRIGARFGEGVVRIAHPVASHIPERAQAWRAFEGVLPGWQAVARTGPRPLRLLDHPERLQVLAEVPDGPPLRFVWRRVARRVVRADGPERIAPEWWKLSEKGARARDYYRVEDEAGRRYWVYRDGLYDDGRGGPPEWYVQGLFL